MSSNDNPGDRSPPRDADQLVPQVYDELRRLAAHYFRNQPPDLTLQPTALVHEAYLRLLSLKDAKWNDTNHFYRVAAKAMRQILVNYARDRRRLKRGGGRRRVTLEGVITIRGKDATDILALEEALEGLAALDARKNRVVELRYFAGLTIDETAQVLDISPATVKSDWNLARAWLLRKMSAEEPSALERHPGPT